MKTSLKRNLKISGVGVLCAFISGSVFAAVTLDEPLPPTTDSAGELIEEIEVLGQRSLLSFRVEMQRAEDHMFDMFNALSSSDDFTVTCRWRTRELSHMRFRSCTRRYMEQAESDATRDAIEQQMPAKSSALLWMENQDNHDQFSAELKRIAEENPEFAQAVIDVVNTRQRYADERKERSRNSLLGRLAGDGE